MHALGILLAALAAVVFASWALIAIAHVNDTYGNNHVSGAWLALAQYVNHGVLYPSLYNGSSFGGTRNMPLEFVAHAGLARVTGEYLVSGKLLVYATGAGLYTLAFFVMRKLSRSAALALGLVAAVMVTQVGLQAITGVRGDALPAALQLGAVAWVASESRRSAAGAGLLCALALASKLSTLWAPIAIVIWLLIHDRRRLAVFLGSFVVLSVLILGFFELASSGRMSEDILHLGGSGLSQAGQHALDAPNRLIYLFQTGGDAVWLLFPLALAGLVLAAFRRRLTIYHVSFLVAIPLLLFVLTDVGAFSNHLIDLMILTIVLVAEAWGASEGIEGGRLLRIALLVVVIWGVASSYQLLERSDAAGAARSLLGHDPSYGATPLRGIVTSRDRVLSEDPYVPVSRGQNPVVLDPFMLLRIASHHPAWRDALVRRIRAHEFTKVILMRRLDPIDPWWHDQHFGPQIANAISQSYRLQRTAPRYYHPNEPSQGTYYVYVPRS